MGLEDRIERAEGRAASSRSCAADRLDIALGHDRAADAEAAQDERDSAARHTANEEAHLRSAQALKNVIRRHRWAVRRLLAFCAGTG